MAGVRWGGELVKKMREVKEEEVMLGGRVVNCSIFAGNLNAN